MLIPFGQQFEVDTPITDLDDPEDNTDLHLGAESRRDEEQDVQAIHDLDYESENESSNYSVLLKFKSFFGKPQHEAIESLEMSDLGTTNSLSNMVNLDTPFRFKENSRAHKVYMAFNFTMRSWLIILISIFIVGIYMKSQKDKNDIRLPLTNELLTNSTEVFRPTTLVVSLDGFHPHYINPNITPTLHDMLLNDYGAPYMIPSFPSSTFPNHWTLVTGLYPSEHGIVGNTFFDPILKRQFINTNPKVGGLDPDFWQGGEPIWKTASNQGIKSAIHMWPGSEVPGVGIGNGPLYVDKYNGSEALSSKVHKVMSWLDIGDINKRPQLILTYVPTIDQFGHKYGIEGSELQTALSYVDDFVDLLLKELDNRNLSNVTNLIILSDHGMAPTSNQRVIYLDELLDLGKVEHIDGWPLFGLRPFGDYAVDDIMSEINENLHKVDTELAKHYLVTKIEDIPGEWEFGGRASNHKFNYRLAPIWIIPDVGYSVTTHKQMDDNNGQYKPKGVHGYNNTELLMRALFLGKGPYFSSRLEQSTKLQPFKNTEIYNLICDTLNIIPAPNNGTYSTSNPLVSSKNVLPFNWIDKLKYPGTAFKTSHIVEGATYDFLWGSHADLEAGYVSDYSTNKDPYSSLISEESHLKSIDRQGLPKPSDFLQTSETKISSPTSTSTKNENLWDKVQDAWNDIGGSIESAAHDALDEIEDFVDGIGDRISDENR